MSKNYLLTTRMSILIYKYLIEPLQKKKNQFFREKYIVFKLVKWLLKKH